MLFLHVHRPVRNVAGSLFFLASLPAAPMAAGGGKTELRSIVLVLFV